MRGSWVEQLIAIASPALGSTDARFPQELLDRWGARAAELAALLKQKNGLLAFESALHLFPIGPVTSGYSLEAWNSPTLWREGYEDAAQDALFFAEDIFGEQFCIRGARIWRFNPETGDSEELAPTLEQWAQRLLEDYNLETGYALAHEWQNQYGALPLGKRLLPKIPFVAGGKYAVENLYATDAVTGMRFRADLARQIRNLPDGTQIRFQITED
ncbi:MAG TPA: hypothetical protein VFZ66_21425 [Herpetosiphonaceae bacterium]